MNQRRHIVLSMMKHYYLLSVAILFSFLGISADAFGQASVPYMIDFTQSQEGWTTIGSGKNWFFATGTQGYYNNGNYYDCVKLSNDYSQTDHYYVSPAFELKAGKTYIVESRAFTNMMTLTICVGNDNTDAASMVKKSVLNASSAPMDVTTSFEVETDGTYYVAVLGQTVPENEWAPGECGLFSFTLRVDGEGPVTPPTQPTADIPYEIDFTQATTDWAAIDHNDNADTWTEYGNMGVAITTSKGDADDSYMSPEFTLEAGKEYIINTGISSMYPEESSKLTLTIANNPEMKDAKDVATLTIPEMGPGNEEFRYEPTESGKYHFAYHYVAPMSYYGGTVYLNSFAIKEVEAPIVTPDVTIFTDDFSTEDPMVEWTAVNNNDDNATWRVIDGIDGLTYNSEEAVAGADDYIVTPAILVSGGQDYIVSYRLNQSSAFGADQIEVCEGSAAEAGSLTNVLAKETISFEDGYGTFNGVCRFTASETGDVFFAIHIVTPEENGKLSLTYFEVKTTEKPTPQPVSDLNVISKHDEKTVSLTWKNPSFDTKDTPIDTPINIDIYENYQCIKTIENLAAGTAGEYTYSPEIFEGERSYKVIAVIGENESTPVSMTINLDDIEGELSLVHSFSNLSKDDAAAWVIEDNGGTSSWGYSLGGFWFDYKLGQKNDNDWLIAPAVEFDAEKRYIAKYEIKVAESYCSSIDVTIGNQQTYTAQTTILASYPNLYQNGFGKFETKQFTVSETGNYYIGFHVTKADYSVDIRNLEIYFVDPDGEGGDEPGGSGVESNMAESCAYYVFATSTLVIPANIATVQVYDMQGRIVKANANASSTILSLADCAKGAYVAVLYTTNGKKQTIKLMR